MELKYAQIFGLVMDGVSFLAELCILLMMLPNQRNIPISGIIACGSNQPGIETHSLKQNLYQYLFESVY